MTRIVVIGGGGHAKVLISLLKKLEWKILGYTDPSDRGAILGAPYLGPDETLASTREAHGRCCAFLGVGKTDAAATRRQVRDSLVIPGSDWPVIVSPQAVVNEQVVLSEGTVVMDGAVVNSGTVTDAICILNTNCTVDHDCRLGENVHVAPGATLSGGVTVGQDTMIGAGATVIQGLTVCPGCLVGAGATVIADIAIPGVYVGSPARRIG